MMIECSPEYSGFIRWKQSHFPSIDDEIIADDAQVEGLEIDERSDWKTNIFGTEFTGLARSSYTSNTLFDCTSKQGIWYFAIGMKKEREGQSNLIPCYSYSKEISLWIRMPDSNCQTNRYSNTNLKCVISSFILLSY